MTLLGSTTGILSPSSFAVGPVPSSVEPTVTRIPGAAVLHSPQCTAASVDAALKALRGFRTAGRRIVWCNATELANTKNVDLRAWGRKLVEQGGAEMAILCGLGGRDLATSARDAGLPLTRVVVCRDDATARNVLCDSIAAGDAVLALGVTADSCRSFTERLESRFERELVAN